jgi:hypothetical protein
VAAVSHLKACMAADDMPGSSRRLFLPVEEVFARPGPAVSSQPP